MKNNYIEKNTRKKSVSAVAVVIATAALATAISSVIINEPYKKNNYTVGHWLKENNSKTCVDEGINYANSKNKQVDLAIDPYVLAKDIDELAKTLELLISYIL